MTSLGPSVRTPADLAEAIHAHHLRGHQRFLVALAVDLSCVLVQRKSQGFILALAELWMIIIY